jgi:dephospho-CoA kinase
MTKIIGLTGGIGSGKTTIARYIESKGIPVYIADVEAKKVMEEPKILKALQIAFGTDIVMNNYVNRSKLSSIVFNNPEKLALLNSIIHPAVKIHFKNWLNNHENEPFVIKETAILFETGGDKECYKTITVVATLENRIDRVISRDDVSKENVIERMNNQMSDEQRIELSDFVIQNETITSAKNQVDEILKLLKII